MKIRLWRLGSLEHRIQSGERAFVQLRELLAEARASGGVHDVVWDAAIDVQTIDITPDGIDVPVGTVPFTPELRREIEELIVSHLAPSRCVPSEEQEAFLQTFCSEFADQLLDKIRKANIPASAIRSVEVYEDDSQARQRRVGWYGWADAGDHPNVGVSADMSLEDYRMFLGSLPTEVVRRRLVDACNWAVAARFILGDEPPVGPDDNRGACDAGRSVVGGGCGCESPTISDSCCLPESLSIELPPDLSCGLHTLTLVEDRVWEAGAARRCTCPAANFAIDGAGCTCGGC